MQELGTYTQLLNHHHHHHFSLFSRILIIWEANLLLLLKKRYCTEFPFDAVIRHPSVLTTQSRPPQKLSACRDSSLLRSVFHLQPPPPSSCVIPSWQTLSSTVGAIEQGGPQVKRLPGARWTQQQSSSPAHFVSHMPYKVPVMAHCPTQAYL